MDKSGRVCGGYSVCNFSHFLASDTMRGGNNQSQSIVLFMAGKNKIHTGEFHLIGKYNAYKW
jgi:hypothetical protein